jgi:hypothetical protein
MTPAPFSFRREAGDANGGDVCLPPVALRLAASCRKLALVVSIGPPFAIGATKHPRKGPGRCLHIERIRVSIKKRTRNEEP